MYVTEIGLVRLARVALEIAEVVLHAYYRTKVSQHHFTKPRLLAVPCLIYTLRGPNLAKTEVRLAEHGELRRALSMRKAPD